MVRHVVELELVGFGLVVLFLWLDEVLDLPRLLMGAPATPVNWRESLFESLLTAGLAMLAVWVTRRFLLHIKYLEGFLVFCAGCKRVKYRDEWVPADTFVREHSEATITHGLCPECQERYCGEWQAAGQPATAQEEGSCA